MSSFDPLATCSAAEYPTSASEPLKPGLLPELSSLRAGAALTRESRTGSKCIALERTCDFIVVGFSATSGLNSKKYDLVLPLRAVRKSQRSSNYGLFIDISAVYLCHQESAIRLSLQNTYQSFPSPATGLRCCYSGYGPNFPSPRAHDDVGLENFISFPRILLASSINGRLRARGVR